MAPAKLKTEHGPEKTKGGEEVLDLVIPYIHDVEDRNSLSLVSRKFYELDGITRKRLTVHVLYQPNPASVSKRFPFVEKLKLKGTTSFSKNKVMVYELDIQITSWIEQLALLFRCLKELTISRLVVHDEDLEILARTRGKDLRSLDISKCKGFSTDGLRHVSKYCNQLKTLYVGYLNPNDVKDGIWLHQLALNSTVLEIFKFKNTNMVNPEDLTLLVKNCCKSLISLKFGACYLSKLRDAFRYAVRLEHFGGINLDEDSELVGFQFPLSIRCLSGFELARTQYSRVLPLLNQIRILKPGFVDMDEDSECFLFKRCPNLEVLDTEDVGGDTGLQVLGQFCKKLRKLSSYSLVTQVGITALAKGCTNLESLEISVGDISNETFECLGTHLKNLCKFRVSLLEKNGTTDLPPLDSGILAMLMGCRKLERLDINLWHGGLTDLGWEYIGKYGANLRSLSLTHIGKFYEGLVKLSQGCPRLRMLKLTECPFGGQAVAAIVFNMPSLRYVWLHRSDRTALALTRPAFQL